MKVYLVQKFDGWEWPTYGIYSSIDKANDVCKKIIEDSCDSEEEVEEALEELNYHNYADMICALETWEVE